MWKYGNIQNKSQIILQGIIFCIPLWHNFLIYFMKEGKVKFFNASKGFGFIKDNETNEEHFVHVSGLVDTVSEDDEVTFELQQGRKGLNAVNVKLA
jgi:CspA family cold shock protein